MNSNTTDKSHILKSTGVRNISGWTNEPLTSVKFTTTLDNKVAVITLSRPKHRNAWTEIMRNELSRCIDQASKMKHIRATIITGDPQGNAFCAGADLSPAGINNPSSMQGDVPEGRNPNIQYWRDGGGTAGLAIMRSTKPVICAINGAAVGIGMTLPLAADMTICDENAKVGFVFGKRGLTMECLSSTMLQRCVGHKKAMELVLTGRVFRGRDAPSGLFNYILPHDQVMNKALELCKEICETSPMSSMINRNMIIRNAGMSVEEAHLIESKSIYWVGRQTDCKEGITSFLEKREAHWPMDPFDDAPDWYPWWKEISTKSKL
tara:strand:- start:187 stop:1149 length:963 start_codon:yes stop_codon:yes gene_type:complete